jgi:hypothetical protein
VRDVSSDTGSQSRAGTRRGQCDRQESSEIHAGSRLTKASRNVRF